MTITESEIGSLADLYVKCHGSEALVRARKLAAALEAEGDADGTAIWALVWKAIEKMQRGEQPSN